MLILGLLCASTVQADISKETLQKIHGVYYSQTKDKVTHFHAIGTAGHMVFFKDSAHGVYTSENIDQTIIFTSADINDRTQTLLLNESGPAAADFYTFLRWEGGAEWYRLYNTTSDVYPEYVARDEANKLQYLTDKGFDQHYRNALIKARQAIKLPAALAGNIPPSKTPSSLSASATPYQPSPSPPHSSAGPWNEKNQRSLLHGGLKHQNLAAHRSHAATTDGSTPWSGRRDFRDGEKRGWVPEPNPAADGYTQNVDDYLENSWNDFKDRRSAQVDGGRGSPTPPEAIDLLIDGLTLD